MSLAVAASAVAFGAALRHLGYVTERDAQPARRRARAGRQPPPASSRARLSRAPARDRASIITDFNVRARRRRSVRPRARIAQRRVPHDVL